MRANQVVGVSVCSICECSLRGVGARKSYGTLSCCRGQVSFHGPDDLKQSCTVGEDEADDGHHAERTMPCRYNILLIAQTFTLLL